MRDLFSGTSHLDATQSHVRKLSRDIAEQTESIFLHELNELVSKGILEVETEGPVFTTIQTPDGELKVAVSQKVRLLPKEQDYIAGLEAENAELKARLTAIEEFMKGMPR